MRVLRLALLASLLAALAPTRPAFAGARPAVPGRPSLVAPVIVDGAPREQAWVFPSESRADFLVEAEPLLAALAEDLPAARVAALRAAVEAPGVIRLGRLEAEGFGATFDPASLELLVTVPPVVRRRAVRNVVTRGVVPSGPLYGPADVSGRLNLSVSQPFREPRGLQGSNRDPLATSLDLALNAKGWVLESGATYTEHDPVPWQRGDTALVHDFESRMLRLRVGDQQTPTFGYLSGRAVGGVGVERVFAIQPYLTAQPVSRTELLLKRPSTVDVIVNGVPQSQLRLPAGPVSVQDFPLASGFNNVTLRITDDLGRTELVSLNLFYDPELLGKGVQSFSYHVGAPWTLEGSRRRYHTDNPDFSFFHRAGLTDSFTGGVFGQSEKHQWLAGLDGLVVGRLGTGGLTLAASGLRGLATDLAGRLRLETPDGYHGHAYPWRFSVEGEYRGWSFAPVGQLAPLNPYGWALSEYNLYRGWRHLDLGVGAAYRFRRAADADQWEARADSSSLLSDSLRLSLNYAYRHDTLGEHRAYLALTWIEPTGRHYATASYDYPSKTERLEVVRNPAQAFDDVRLAADVASSPSAVEAGFQGEYQAQRAVLRLDHRSDFSRAPESPTSHVTTLGFGTALVWAGSAVSVSRPVTDSFVILPANGAARGAGIAVNPQGTSAEAYAGGFLPGVLPNVTSYTYTPVSLGSGSLPLGTSLPEEYFQVKAGYESGAVVPIGADVSATVVGTLASPDGSPLPLASGEILAGGAARGPVFFTNRRGQFVAEGLPAGAYRLRFYGGDWADVPFTVPEGASGILKIGTLHVTKGAAP
jgi:outer membrane usher protein